MTLTDARRAETVPTPTRGSRARTAYRVLIGLSALAVLLQGLWAGIFLEHDGGRDAASRWIDVHARGGELAILFTLLAALVAGAALRHRRDLVLGTIVLLVLLVLESYLGGLIRDQSKDTLTAVHVPLAMGIMALAVWLPLRARHSRSARTD